MKVSTLRPFLFRFEILDTEYPGDIYRRILVNLCSLLYPDKPELGAGTLWKVFKIQAGLLFHNRKTFLLPPGLLITSKEPLLMNPLIRLERDIRKGRADRFPDWNRERLRARFFHAMEKEHFGQRASRRLNELLYDRGLAGMFAFHAKALYQEPNALARVYVKDFEPKHCRRNESRADDLDPMQEFTEFDIETYFYILQCKILGYYYGPAPLFHNIVVDKVRIIQDNIGQPKNLQFCPFDALVSQPCEILKVLQGKCVVSKFLLRIL